MVAEVGSAAVVNNVANKEVLLGSSDAPQINDEIGSVVLIGAHKTETFMGGSGLESVG